jgi:hypothetical protein
MSKQILSEVVCVCLCTLQIWEHFGAWKYGNNNRSVKLNIFPFLIIKIMLRCLVRILGQWREERARIWILYGTTAINCEKRQNRWKSRAHTKTTAPTQKKTRAWFLRPNRRPLLKSGVRLYSLPTTENHGKIWLTVKLVETINNCYPWYC